MRSLQMVINYGNISLILLVPRVLVPKPSTKGGGGGSKWAHRYLKTS